jgi:glycosyltransferase involved in cell wall biosynthesis
MTNKTNQLRIAWLLPVAWFYWQPAISELAQEFPDTKVFTAKWPGYAKGYENALEVEVVGQRKVLEVTPSQAGYGSTFTYVSPAVIWPLIRFRPHIIFTNSFGIWTLLALLLKLLWRWKVVIAYEGSSPGVDFSNSKARLLLRRFTVQVADAAISNSQSGRAYLTDVLHLSPDKAFAFPYEVPSARSLLTSDDSTDSVAVPTQKPTFLFVGRIMPRKGLRLLLEACVLLKELGYKGYEVLIVGDGKQREELEEYATTQQLDDRVTWVGRVDYNQISSYFHQADVFLLPTLEDTWGVVVLEAMLFGKPVLCSTGAGTSELIENGRNGYVFAPDDASALAEIMSKFIVQPDLATRMGEQSKEVMAEYTPEKAAQFLAQVTRFVGDRPSQSNERPPQEEGAI